MYERDEVYGGDDADCGHASSDGLGHEFASVDGGGGGVGDRDDCVRDDDACGGGVDGRGVVGAHVDGGDCDCGDGGMISKLITHHCHCRCRCLPSSLGSTMIVGGNRCCCCCCVDTTAGNSDC